MVVFVRLWNAINSFRFRAIFIGQQMALRTDYSGEYLLGGAGWHIVFVKKLGNRTAGVGGGKQAGAGIHCYGNDTGRAAEAAFRQVGASAANNVFPNQRRILAAINLA